MDLGNRAGAEVEIPKGHKVLTIDKADFVPTSDKILTMDVGKNMESVNIIPASTRPGPESNVDSRFIPDLKGVPESKSAADVEFDLPSNGSVDVDFGLPPPADPNANAHLETNASVDADVDVQFDGG